MSSAARQGDTPYVDDYDYVPDEAYLMAGIADEDPYSEQAPAAPATPTDAGLTVDERTQVRAERELLLLMATDVDALRPHADRIATLVWVDERHEAMAWAMLATPEGTAPAEVVRAAQDVVSDAPQILASGSVASSDSMSDEAKVSFVLDTVELCSTRRRILALRAQLRSGSATSSESFREATRLQQHANELTERLSRY
jgi:DNA primase